jgi:hypothetical protein
MKCNEFRRPIRVVLAIGALVGLRSASVADDFAWQPFCDHIWQSCCDLNVDTKTNNWGRFSPAPVCPAQPTGADTVTITSDCAVAPTPAVAAFILNQEGGTFTLNGNLGIGQEAAFEGPFIWNAGEIGRSGGAAAQFARLNGGLTIAGDAEKFLSFFGGFRLTNAGVGSWSGSGSWTIGMAPGGCCPAIFENAAGATFTVLTDAPILQTAFGLGQIENLGTLIKDGSTGQSVWNASLSNNGLLHVKTGELKLTGGGSADGAFLVDAGATLAFSGAAMVLQPGVGISGQGTAVVKDSNTGISIAINDDVTLGRIAVASNGRVGDTGLMRISDLLTIENGGDVRVNTRILPGARLECIGVANFWFHNLEIAGIAHIPDGSTLSANNNGLTILPGGEIQIEDGGSLTPLGNGVQPIENHGMIRKMAGTGVGTIASAFGWYLNNYADGRIQVDEGTLVSSNNLDDAGQVHIAAGATFKQQGWGTYHSGANFTGDGWFHLENAQNNFIDQGFTLEIPRLRISGNINAGQGLTGQGGLSVSQRLEMLGGGLYMNGGLTIQPGAEFSILGPNIATAYSAIENFGTTRIIGQDFSFGGPFNNHAGAVVSLESDYYFGGRFGNGVLNNEGTVRKSAGSGDTAFGGTLNNIGGLVLLESGRIVPNAYIQASGATQLAGGGILTGSMTLNGGSLSGTGTLTANLSNAGGTILPGASPGTLNIASSGSPSVTGDFSQGVNGSLRIQIGGTAPGAQYDQLTVSHNVTLNGGLNIARINGFNPQVGDSFVILTWGNTRSGTFARVSGTQIGNGKRFTVQYNTNNVTLVVTADGGLPGDLDGSGDVGLQDLAILLSSFGVCDGAVGYNAAADIDGDGCVALSDLAILLSNFGA